MLPSSNGVFTFISYVTLLFVGESRKPFLYQMSILMIFYMTVLPVEGRLVD